VLCDIDTLNTLPVEVFRDGCAEVIKYGILFDPALFSHLEEMDIQFDRERVISRCVELKRDVVAEDEFDIGKRMLLNLGHTIGHAIEKCSNYRISHGKAVAIGIAIVSRATKCPDWERICALLTKFDLPTATEYSATEICECALMDKKRSGEHINLVIPKAIGDCIIQPTPIEKMKSFIEEGL
jgi:3-dehydroquinate synthase